MVLSKEKKEKIAILIINLLLDYHKKFPSEDSINRNVPFHKAFLNSFSDKIENIPSFLNLSSWLQGLNTALGQSFFEKVAHILCNGTKKQFTFKEEEEKDNKEFVQITENQRKSINEIMINYTNSNMPDLKVENKALFKEDGSKYIQERDFITDVFIEKEDKIIAIELKSVKPNSGEMRSEKEKMLIGKAALFNKYKDKQIYFYLGFPFDSTSDDKNPTKYDKERFLKTLVKATDYLDPTEILLSSELWDFLSNKKNTMENIIEIITAIATNDFEKNYDNLLESIKQKNKKNQTKNDELKKLLKKWYITSDVKITESKIEIKQT